MPVPRPADSCRLAALVLFLPAAMAFAESGAAPSPEEATAPGSEIWVGAPIVGASPCEQLEQRVCGESGACSARSACVQVQEWLETERKQRAASDRPGRMTHASGQCQEADRDRQTFTSCDR